MTAADAVPSTAGRAPALARLARDLAAAGLAPAPLRALLGAAAGPLVDGPTEPARRYRLEADASAAAVLARLYVLGDAVPADDVDAHLGDLADRLVDAGLAVAEGTALRGTVRLVPHEGLLVASDRPRDQLPRDHVAGVHRPSALLAHLTVRRTPSRALDLGTGCGIQALLAARHAERVVATDVNERALAVTALNCALNGIANVELRAGSLFEPVAGERFGLVVANPPYVISPAHDLIFRDSGMPDDAVSAAVVRGAATALAADGHATVLVSWVADGDDALARPAGWVDGAGCDAWILHTGSDDVYTTAAQWNAGAGDGGASVRRWLDWYAQRGIAQIAYGAVVLHRRDGPTWTRATPIPRGTVAAGGQLEQMLAVPPGPPPATARVRISPAVRLRTAAALGEAGWQAQEIELARVQGIPFTVGLDAGAAALVAQLDGRPLADVEPPDEAPAAAQRLLELGLAERLD
jgi:hypothetical protein